MRNTYAFKILIAFALALFLNASAFGQTTMLSGTVTSASDELGIPGVSILVKESTRGTITDADGKFSIQVSDGEILVFSFIGMKTQEITFSGQSKIDVKMEDDFVGLDEVIAIGYGTQKKEDKTGAVAQITADEMASGVLQDPIQAIQGKASGVMISKKGGDPNAGFSMKIRGASGFDSNTQPLYVVDGVSGVDITTVSPNDIESFNILKDAASTAIYGSQGSNGVVIITTKSGKSGKGKVEFNMNLSADQVSNTLDLLSASDLRDFATKNNIDLIDNGANTNWQDEIFRTGYTQTYGLNFSGGTEQSTYYASVTQANWTGVMRGTEKDRTIAKVNLSHKALNDRLTLSGSISGTFEQNDKENYENGDKDAILYQAYSRNPTDPVYNADGTYFKTTREFNYENPIATINQVDNLRDAKRLYAFGKVDYEFLKGLNANVMYAYTKDEEVLKYFRPNGLYADGSSGYASQEFKANTQKLLEATANYVKTINENHNLNVIGGYSYKNYDYSGFKAGGTGPSSNHIKYDNFKSLVDVTRDDISSFHGAWSLIGFFARAQYNFKQKYYVSASGRYDGSTKFGVNNKWGFFPTFAAGWNIDREDFLASSRSISQLKLRASYGISGNQEFDSYRSQVLFEPTDLGTDPETGNPIVIYQQKYNTNPDLKWEQTSELNFGLDFGFWSNKLSGSLEFYAKETTDLLGRYRVPVPPYPVNEIWANSGTMTNQGVELNIAYNVINSRSVKWKTSLIADHNKQIMRDLGAYAPADGRPRTEGYLSGRGLVGDQNYVGAVAVGESLGSFYLPEFVQLSSDGYFLYRSETGGVTREISKAKRYFAGSALPDLTLGWTNNFTLYDNWTIDFSFRSWIGNDLFNATQMFFDYPNNIPNLNGLPEAVDWYEQGRVSSPAPSDYYLEDASFVRLDYITIGYNFKLPSDFAIQSIRLNVSANNLFTLTNYSGLDPETSADGVIFGIDQYNVYPKSRAISFGAAITF